MNAIRAAHRAGEGYSAMRKRFCIFAATVLVLLACTVGFSPTLAFAADGDSISVGGIEFTGSADTPAYATTDASGTVTAGGTEDAYNVKWDGTTLTLNNAKFDAVKSGTGYAIETEYGKVFDFTIRLVGENACGTIRTQYDCPVTIIGTEGSSLALRSTGTSNSAIDALGDIVIDGATVTATSNEGGFSANLSDIIIKNGAHVNVDVLTGNAYYFLMAHSIRIENSTVDALSEGTDSNPLWACGDSSDSLSIVGSTVTVTAESAINPAIWAPNIEVTGGSDVTVIGNESNAVYSDGTITVDGSSFQVEGMSPDASPALYAYGDIDVTNSIVTARSAGMRGIFTDADMTISDNSTVTASGATDEGMVVVGKLTVVGSKLHASTSSDNEMVPALVAEQLEAVASDVTLEGGLDLREFYNGAVDNASLVIEPAAGKLTEFKVDGQNRNGSAAVHFREEGSDSPYGTRTELTDAQMNWLGAYRYVHIGEHVHAGGTATCTALATCDGCGREYGSVDPDAHSFTAYVPNNDATCTMDGTETAACNNGCGARDTRTAQGSALGHVPELVGAKPATSTDAGYSGDEVCKRCGELLKQGAAIPALGHSFADGVCTVCGEKGPDNVAPEEPKKNDTTIPATGDASAFASLVPALAGASALTAGVFARRRRR